MSIPPTECIVPVLDTVPEGAQAVAVLSELLGMYLYWLPDETYALGPHDAEPHSTEDSPSEYPPPPLPTIPPTVARQLAEYRAAPQGTDMLAYTAPEDRMVALRLTPKTVREDTPEQDLTSLYDHGPQAKDLEFPFLSKK